MQEILYSKGTVQGKILRPMRIVDPEQDEYCGLVQVGIEREWILCQHTFFSLIIYTANLVVKEFTLH